MKAMLCLLMMLLLAACASHPGVTHVSPASKSSVTSEPKMRPVDRYYEEIMSGPLAGYTKGDPPEDEEKGSIFYLATGEFKFGLKSDHLMMEVWCVEVLDTEVATYRVKDEPAKLLEGKYRMYLIPFFQHAMISVETDEGGRQEVRLHYRDARKAFHHIALSPRSGKKGKDYQFSFDRLVPDDVESVSISRAM